MSNERKLAHATLQKQKMAMESWLDRRGWPWDGTLSGWLDRVIGMLDTRRKHG